MKNERKKYDVTVDGFLLVNVIADNDAQAEELALKSAAEILERAKSKNSKIKKLEITPDGAVYTKFIPDIKDYRLVWIQVAGEVRMITSLEDSRKIAALTYATGDELSEILRNTSPEVKDFLYTQVGISLVRRAA